AEAEDYMRFAVEYDRSGVGALNDVVRDVARALTGEIDLSRLLQASPFGLEELLRYARDVNSFFFLGFTHAAVGMAAAILGDHRRGWEEFKSLWALWPKLSAHVIIPRWALHAVVNGFALWPELPSGERRMLLSAAGKLVAEVRGRGRRVPDLVHLQLLV